MNMTPEEKDLTALLDSLTWDERAKADSGQPIAPAFDKEFKPCWNVWVDNFGPKTFHTHAEANAYAATAYELRHTVYTDFEFPLPLGIQP